MSEHYVCTGTCNGLSDKAGACQAGDCNKAGKPLTGCTCEDNQHAEAKEKEQ